MNMLDRVMQHSNPEMMLASLTPPEKRMFLDGVRILLDRLETTDELYRDAMVQWNTAESKLLALLSPSTPMRRLREYKGVTFKGGYWLYEGREYRKAASVIADSSLLTDADHAALLALRDDPWETVETVKPLEDVLWAAFRGCPTGSDVYAYTADAVRAWIADQVSSDDAPSLREFFGKHPNATRAETLEAVLTEWWHEAPRTFSTEEYIANLCTRIRAWVAANVPTSPVLSDHVDGLVKAAVNLLRFAERNECRHEETHRGGAIWEICDGCGAKWADDRGGKPAYVESPEITATRAALDLIKQKPMGPTL